MKIHYEENSEYSKATDYILNHRHTIKKISHIEHTPIFQFPGGGIYPITLSSPKIITVFKVTVPDFEMAILGTKINQILPEVVRGNTKWTAFDEEGEENKLYQSMNKLFEWLKQPYEHRLKQLNSLKFTVETEDFILRDCSLLEYIRQTPSKYIDKKPTQISVKHQRNELDEIVSATFSYYKSRQVVGVEFTFNVKHVTRLL